MPMHDTPCMHAAITPAIVMSTSSAGMGCVPIPEGPRREYSSLEVVWSEKREASAGQRLCHCPPFEGEQHLFSRCISTTSCDTDYSVTVSNGSVCFAGLSPPLTSIPVYFTLLRSCANNKCVIRSLLTSFMITISKCYNIRYICLLMHLVSLRSGVFL